MPSLIRSYGDELALAKAEPVLALHARAQPLETATNKFLAFAIGLTIGVLTVTRDYIGSPRDLFSRVAPVDFICIAMLVLLFLNHRMKAMPVRSLLYAGAIVLSLIPGLLVTGGERIHVWVSAAALLMAFGYYLLGLNLGASPALIRCMLTGLCIGVFFQGLIVLHDTMASNSAAQWFPDPMAGRARGTFKTNGQLGAYSFCAAGLLLTFGTTMGSLFFRRSCAVLGLAASSFAFLASRRMGMLCMFIWGLLFVLRGIRFWERKSYKLFVVAFFAGAVALAIKWPDIQDTFMAQRFMNAVNGITKDEGFIQNQFRAVVHSANNWFPWGFGVGEGAAINPDIRQEVHNGILAVLVELGVLGILGFMGMVLYPIVNRAWRKRSRDHDWLNLQITTFLIVSLLFMFHNTLARDRAFLLFLGIATTVMLQESRKHEPSVYFPESEEPQER